MSGTLHVRTPRLLVGFCIAVAVAVCNTQLLAQAPPAKSVKGIIEAINPDGTIAVIEAISNAPWYVQLTFDDPMPAKNSKIAIIGTAEPAALSSGTWVEFKADINNKTNIGAADLKELSIYEPTAATLPGAYLEGGPDAALEAGKSANSKFLVRGQVKKVTKTELQVFAPGSDSTPPRSIKMKLASDVKINVDLMDLQYAHKGDSISVDGKLTQPVEGAGKTATPGIVTGDKVAITLAQPLGATKKRPSKK